ncbi:MAG: hypothetical protein ABWY56_01060 [Propionibacteriaceae bacterium]
MVMQQLADQKRKRGWYVLVIGVLLFLSLVLPHVHLDDQPYGNSLLLTGFYFLHAQSATFVGVDTGLLAFGFNVTYLGLALHELGLMLAATTFWVLYPQDINRWLFRSMVIGGWALMLSTPFVILGWQLMGSAGAAANLGLAWLPMLLSGIAITVMGRGARDRVDRTTYITKPELM